MVQQALISLRMFKRVTMKVWPRKATWVKRERWPWVSHKQMYNINEIGIVVLR